MGGQAQVVTFTLDALLAMGESFDTVLVLHLAPTQPRVKRALTQLTGEFAGGRYRTEPVDFRHLPLQHGERALPAVRTEDEAEAVWKLARNLLSTLKGAGERLHLCIAGGPRLLALTLTSAAMLHCDHRDRLWHLYTPRTFIEEARGGAILHAPPEVDIRLVPVPLAPWGAYFPALRALAQPTSASAVDPADSARCAAVWGRLTPRQREVTETLAEGRLPQEAADALDITLKTLDTHKTQILAECRIAWHLPEDEHLTYHFLQDKFGPWLALTHT